METSLMGLTPIDVRRLSYDFATELGVNHNFNRAKGMIFNVLQMILFLKKYFQYLFIFICRNGW